MFQLAMDLPACEALGPGPEFRLLPRPSPRPPRLWSFKSGQPARTPAPVWSPRPARVERSHGQMPSPRAKRAHRPRDQVAALGPKAGLAKTPAAAKPSPSLGPAPSSASPPVGSGAPTDQQALLRRGRRQLPAAFNSFDLHLRGSRPTTEAEFIAWGPTGEEEALAANTIPDGPTTVSYFQTRKTTAATATTTATATTATALTLQTRGVTAPLDPRNRVPAGLSTTEPSTSPSRDSGKDTKPPRILGETSGTPPLFWLGFAWGEGFPGGMASGGGVLSWPGRCFWVGLRVAEPKAKARGQERCGAPGRERCARERAASIGGGNGLEWVLGRRLPLPRTGVVRSGMVARPLGGPPGSRVWARLVQRGARGSLQIPPGRGSAGGRCPTGRMRAQFR